MTKQEEQLWDYIDGLSSEAESAEIAAKLATDEQFQQLYVQLLEVNQQLETHLEIDEPSMSFTRNVMEQVQHEIAPVKLKTKVDNRIIYAIGGFFALSLVSILVYAIATAVPNFTSSIPSLNLENKFDGLLDTKVIMIFLFVNAVLLLIYLDGFLRKGMKKAQKKGEQ
jgi:anti-sigma factor RsiW